MTHLMDYLRIREYGFDQRPKGDLFKLAVNPYNGKVLVKVEKHEASYAVALDLMRSIVGACDFLERNGSVNPLRDLLSCDGFDFDSLGDAAKVHVIVFDERSDSGETGDAAEGYLSVEKAS